MHLRREASTMGDLVSHKKAVGWRVSFVIGLLLVQGLAAVAAPADQLGTADNPFLGPEPEGVRASQLVSVVSETYGETALVELVGDGEFTFTAFRLEEPARFVMDLPGVVKTTEQGSLPVDHAIVAQVRLAQYRSHPEPISRVVFDLRSPAVPRIEPTPEGLAVSFSADSLEAAFPSVEAAGEELAAVEPLPEEVEAPPVLEAETEAAVAQVTQELPEIELPVETTYEPIAVAEVEPLYVDEPLVEEPVLDVPVIEEAVAQKPVVEEPVIDSMAEEPVLVEDPILAEEPIAAEVIVEMPEPMIEEVVESASPIDQEAELAALPPTTMIEETALDEPFQVAAVDASQEAPVEVEPMPMPLPEPARAGPVVEATDTAMFDVANVQVEESGDSAADSAARGFEAQEVGAQRRYQGAPMDLSLQDADVKDVLRSFAQLSGLNLVVQPGVRGRVTVELVQVPWDQALEQVLKITDLGYELEGNIMRVAPIRKLREEAEEQQRLVRAQALSVPLSTVIRRISYARANDIARVLTARGGVMSSRGSVIVDRRTNTLIIKELPAFMNTVIAIIENLDIPEPQVMIEARIIETTKRFSRSLGIAWGFAGVASAATGNETGLEFPAQGSVDGGVQLLSGGNNGFINLSMGNILNTFNLDATLNAAEAEGLINILSAPRVATLNNERASIQSGLQIPIQTVANNTVSVQFVNATLRLDVTPQVTAEGTVLMEINIQKREPQLAFAVVGATNAPISTKEARTRVIVRDGGTTVIGGIYEVSTDQGEDRVPGLANVPVIKHLFRNKRRSDENEELLIFITPRVTKL